MAEGNIEERIREDRISGLPEDLLVTILSLVPIKDAVATMILSKRWRFVWMMLPRLDYKEGDDYFYDDDYLENNDDDDGGDDESKKKIWWFIDKSLELHKAPVLEILLIKLGSQCPSDADIGKWLAKAVDSGVVVLKIKLCWSTGPTTLPKNLYNCETLEELTLSHKFFVDFPSSSSLPSLHCLELFHVVYKDEASLASFLSSCPVLSILHVKRNKDDNVTKFSVNVPSLLFFWYYNYDHHVVAAGRCLAVNTPALLGFNITDYSRDSCSIEIMPSLRWAQVNVESFPDIDKFKTCLSRVLSLELVMTDEVLVHCSTINFFLLTKLSICPHISDWLEALILLLKNAPKLKDLLVNLECAIRPTPFTWKQPSLIPGCLSSQLETFEYKRYENIKQEEEFLTYILAHSNCLKTATISLRPNIDPHEQGVIIEVLTSLPRVSTTSQLVFK